jgi:glycine/D-amino acid oxidase-like deaminating enzyme
MPGFAGLYVAVMHSGMTLAPAIGRYAAEECLAMAPQTPLAAFRPDRLVG